MSTKPGQSQSQDIGLPRGSWSAWREHLRRLHSLLDETQGLEVTVAIDASESGDLRAEEHEILYVTALEFDDNLLACYATCRGRLEREETSGRWRFHAGEFVVRDLRLVETSDEAMRAYAREAAAVTGLATTLVVWGTSMSQAEPSDIT